MGEMKVGGGCEDGGVEVDDWGTREQKEEGGGEEE